MRVERRTWRAGSKGRAAIAAVATVALLAGSFLIGSVGSTAQASSYPPIPPGPIKIGMTLDLSGSFGADGIATEHTVEGILAKFHQYYGKVDGHQVEYDIVDDASEATQAVSAAEQLADNHVAAVVNTSYNPAAYTLEIPLLNKDKVLMLSDVAVEQFDNAKAYPYFFSVDTSLPESGKLIASFFKARHLDKIAILTDGLETDTQFVDAMRSALGPSQSVVDTVTIPPGEVDVTTALQQLKATNPDVLLVSVSLGFGSVWDDLQTIGWSPTIMTNEGVFFDGYSAIGSLASSMYTTCATGIPAGVTLPPEVLSTIEAIQAISPGIIDQQDGVQESMDELLILRKVIEETHTLDSTALAKAIESLPHNSSFFWSRWKYNFTASNHLGYSSGSICQVSPLGPHLVPISIYH